MNARLRMVFAAWTALCLAACQSAAPLGPGQPAAGSAGKATIAVRIVTQAGMGVKALPKVAADIAQYTIQLKRPGPDGALETGDEGSPAYSATIPANTYTDPHLIPNIGTGQYYLLVDARDANGISIAKPDSRYAKNVVEVIGGAPLYSPGGTELLVILELLDGTEGKGAAAVTMSPLVQFAPDYSFGLSLVNQADGNVVPHVGPSQQMNLTKLQEGTFDIWSHVSNYNLQVAVPGKRMQAGITVSSEGATTPTTMTWGYSAAALSTPDADAKFTISGTMAIGNDGTTYYTDGTSIKKAGDAAFSIACASTPTALAVGPDGKLYYAEGLDIKDQAGTLLHTAEDVINALAIDLNGDVYYVANKTIRRVGTASPGPEGTNAIHAMALDRSRNLYFVDGTTVKMIVAKAGTYFGQPFAVNSTQTVADFPGDELAGIAVDPAGNLYVANKSKHAIAMIAAANPDPLRVVGTTVAGTDVAALDALTAKITAPTGIAVSHTGTLHFTSYDGTVFVVRRVE